MLQRRFIAPPIALITSLSIGACATPSSITHNDVNNQLNVIPGENIAPQNETPLTEFLNLLTGLGISQEEQQRQADARNVRVQELIAACMQEHGFEYALNFNEGMQIPQTDFSLWNPDDRDWVAQWGYGEVLAPTENPGFSFSEMDAATDPNTEIQERLSSAERQAWQTALHGGPDYELNPGCRATAFDTVIAESPLGFVSAADKFAPLLAALDEMMASLQPEIPFAHDRDWANCMADAGHPGLERQWQAANHMSFEVFQVTGQFGGDFGFRRWDPVAAAATGDLPLELSQMREREIDMALADFDCRVAVDYDARQAAVVNGIETQFVNDHRSALEALRSAFEQRS